MPIEHPKSHTYFPSNDLANGSLSNSSSAGGLGTRKSFGFLNGEDEHSPAFSSTSGSSLTSTSFPVEVK